MDGTATKGNTRPMGEATLFCKTGLVEAVEIFGLKLTSPGFAAKLERVLPKLLLKKALVLVFLIVVVIFIMEELLLLQTAQRTDIPVVVGAAAPFGERLERRDAVAPEPRRHEDLVRLAEELLGLVVPPLGRPHETEREARAANDRGFDPHQAVPLLAQAMLAMCSRSP